MYIPPHFAQTDPAALVAFMRNHVFATMVSVEGGLPIATHLPFLIEERGEELVLITHFAKQNPQQKNIENGEVLVIFQAPHAYISPSFYEKKQNVPTWNYIAVHCYGVATLQEDAATKRRILEKSILAFEEAYMEQWKTLPNVYIENLLRGMVGVEICVSRMEGKEKLSQNKTQQERENIIHGLYESPDSAAREIAEAMKKRETKD